MNPPPGAGSVEAGPSPTETDPLIRELKEKMLGKIQAWLGKQGEVSVETESITAFQRIAEAIPKDSKFKEQFTQLESGVRASGKILAMETSLQDAAWKIAKGLLIGEAPWVVVIPGNINSILQAKSFEWGSKGAAWAIKTAAGFKDLPLAQRVEHITGQIVSGSPKLVPVPGRA